MLAMSIFLGDVIHKDVNHDDELTMSVISLLLLMLIISAMLIMFAILSMLVISILFMTSIM